MPKGNVEPFNLNIKTQNKATNVQIPIGVVCIRNTGITPNGWKASDTANSNGPFCVSVNQTADTTSPVFSAAFAPSEVMVEAGGTIQPGSFVKVDNAGKVVAHVTGTDAEVLIVGRYITKEGENIPVACASTDIIKVRLGMG